LKITAKYIHIHPSAKIEDSVEIHCESFSLGENSYIGENVKIKCRNFSAGKHLYMTSGVEVGRGGCTSPNSTVTIGDYVGIFENTVINPNSPITIGNYVGIGCDVQLWTHGAWLNVLQGFPSSFGPITIGDNVWLPARSIVLPNVEIGENTVVAINSIVNKSLPSGCLAGGNPAKVIKENEYPKQTSSDEQIQIIKSLVNEWHDSVEDKGYSVINFAGLRDRPFLSVPYIFELRVEFDRIDKKRDCIHYYDFKIDCRQQPYSMDYHYIPSVKHPEDALFFSDLIDFLRRNGVKIYKSPFAFKSLTPTYM
jgi:acetyltransferase-like isoleucine patch superfamily enzyme